MPKRVAILTERLKSGFGVDLVVDQQARLLALRHEVAVFAVEIEEDYIKNAPYSVFRNLIIPLYFNPIKQDAASRALWSRYAHLFKGYDTFIIQTPTFNAWLPSLRKLGKTIVYYHGNSPSWGYRGLRKYRKNIFDFSENSYHFRFAHEIISISNFLKSTLKSSLRAKTFVNYHGTEHILNVSKRLGTAGVKALRERYFIEPDDILITYVGRLDFRNNPYKNTQELIKLRQSLPKLNAKGRRIKVFAIGLPENNIEKELFDNDVCVIPNADQESLVAVLGATYFLFSPSLWEGFNLPLIEAQCLGVPVVAYDIGPHAEVVSKDKSGLLLSSFTEVKEVFSSLVNDESRRERMSQEAQQFSKKFSWKKSVKILEGHL